MLVFTLCTCNKDELDELRTQRWYNFWNINPLFAEKHWFIKAEFFHRPVLVLANLSAKHFLLDSKHVLTVSLWLCPFSFPFSSLIFTLFRAPLLLLFRYTTLVWHGDLILAGDWKIPVLRWRCHVCSWGMESTLLWLLQYSPIQSRSKSATVLGLRASCFDASSKAQNQSTISWRKYRKLRPSQTFEVSHSTSHHDGRLRKHPQCSSCPGAGRIKSSGHGSKAGRGNVVFPFCCVWLSLENLG